MKLTHLDDNFSISEQISEADLQQLKQQQVEVIVCNRPDGEETGQPSMKAIAKAAKEEGIAFIEIPYKPGASSAEDEQKLLNTLATGQRIHGYCRTGNRSKQLWQKVQARVGTNKDKTINGSKYDVVIVGAGSAGIATAASLRKRRKDISVALIDPSEVHYYQPGWTMVGGGVFDADSTKRKTVDCIPTDCIWIRNTVSVFVPSENRVELSSGESIHYEQLAIAPGLTLDWAAIEGLPETLGQNGVTSNYRFDLAPYTWSLVQNMSSGKALFTQPPMPIKCAGAPQKAMYLSASEWLKRGKLKNIDIEFHNSGGALFGVKEYVPALMEYVKKYEAKLCFTSTLVKVDGSAQKAWFKDSDGNTSESDFDLLHVCPPQVAPDFIRQSELCDDAGWLDVDPATLQSKKYENIWGVGDVMNTTNAKTMAAARKQAPVVAQNMSQSLSGTKNFSAYDGYGSCPLTVEHGKIVLAEFTYGGQVSPSFPDWLNDGTKATSLAWFLKAKMLPPIYWHGMLKGREWLASPAA